MDASSHFHSSFARRSLILYSSFVADVPCTFVAGGNKASSKSIQAERSLTILQSVAEVYFEPYPILD
jgi:hypothetical protein